MSTEKQQDLQFDLSELIVKHDATTNKRFKLILQDVFHLCLNEDFVESVLGAREQVEELLYRLHDEAVYLPCVTTDAVNYRASLFRNQLWSAYQNILLSIAEKHSFYHPYFIEDKLEFYTNATDVPIGAYAEMNILESLVFFNKPLRTKDDRLPFRPRAGYFEISDDGEGPYIKGVFDIGTDRSTIQTVLDKSFETVEKAQEQQFRIPVGKRRVDTRLAEKYRLHQLSQNGDSIVSMSNTLEKEGLCELSESTDKTKKTLERLRKKIGRFDSIEGDAKLEN